MIGASQLTPTQQEIINRGIAFRRKIRAAAVPDAGIDLKRQRAESVVVPPEPIAVAPASESIEPICWPWFPVSEEVLASPDRKPSIREIQTACADFFGLTRGDLMSYRRPQSITRPRHIAYFLCSHITGRSLPEIGRRFNGRDHTTILYGVRKIESLLAGDAKLSADIQSVRDLIMVRA